MHKVVDNLITDKPTMSDVSLITKEFRTSNDFSQHIEKMANVTNSYIDAVVDYCERRDIEIESVKKLLSVSLKDKIKNEAEGLNMLKGTKGGKLPI
jgi:hydroxymethylglutaryl-CoA reductase